MRAFTSLLLLLSVSFLQAGSPGTHLEAAYYNLPPFIYRTTHTDSDPALNLLRRELEAPESRNSSDIDGMMADVFLEMVSWCYPRNTSLGFVNASGSPGELEWEMHYDFTLPITRTTVRQTFYARFTPGSVFIPVFESPGVFFLSASGYSSSSPTKALFSSWPLVLLIFLASALVGCIIWICERLASTGEFPKTFATGFADGIWWAIITMTTVGYGDRKPGSHAGRVVAIVWILVGLVMIAIFTATLTSAFNFEGTEDIAIRGHIVAVLNNSIAEEIAYLQGAQPQVYPSAEALLDAVSTEKNLHGFLLESLHAQFYSDVIEQQGFLFLQLYSHPLVYGILARERNETTQSCLAMVANSVRTQAIRRYRYKGGSTPLQAKHGMKSASKVSSILGLNVLILAAVAIPLVCMVVIVVVLEKCVVRVQAKHKHEKAKVNGAETRQETDVVELHNNRAFVVHS